MAMKGSIWHCIILRLYIKSDCLGLHQHLLRGTNEATNRIKQTIAFLKIANVTQLSADNSSTSSAFSYCAALAHQQRLTQESRRKFRGNVHISQRDGQPSRRRLKQKRALGPTSERHSSNTSNSNCTRDNIKTARILWCSKYGGTTIHDNGIRG